MEGGAFDTNGDKSLLLTEECLLSKVQERNKGFKKKDYEDIFSRYLGINNFIWLKKGISGDDTHGHIDDIARFVSKNTIMTAVENDKKDANFKNLKQNLKILSKKRNNKKKKFKIIKIPMPKPMFIKKIRVPASYLNFYIANKIVLLPIFKDKNDDKVILIFKKFFKKRKIVPINCRDLIWGFGAIHCLTQQEPKN
jgi:agmatine deiminase